MLEKVSIFSGLNARALKAIERIAVCKRYRRNTIIMEYGDDANTLYFLINGLVKIFFVSEDGKEIVFGEKGPGSYVGELGLLAGSKRTASVQTLEDSEFLVLTRESFERILSEHQDLALILLRDLARKVCEVTENISAFALLDVYGRIVKLFNASSEERQDGLHVVSRLTQQDIADRVGSSREMVTKILKDLKIGGYISVEQRRFVLLKPLPKNW